MCLAGLWKQRKSSCKDSHCSDRDLNRDPSLMFGGPRLDIVLWRLEPQLVQTEVLFRSVCTVFALKHCSTTFSGLEWGLNLKNNLNLQRFLQFSSSLVALKWGILWQGLCFHFISVLAKLTLIIFTYFLQSMEQASLINRIKFPIIPTSKHFIFPIGFNEITSLLHYRLLIRFLFLNEKHVRQSGCRLLYYRWDYYCQLNSPSHPPTLKVEAGGNARIRVRNSKRNIRGCLSHRAISTSTRRVHLLCLQHHYKGPPT
jgi:hypothetical protein